MILLTQAKFFYFNRIFDVLIQREGRETTLPTLVALTNLREDQVQSSIANARRTRPEMAQQIKVIKPGRVWKFQAVKGVGEYESAEDVVKEAEVGSTHIWKRVLKALVDNAGKVTSKNLLAEAASTPESPITPHQAVNAMHTIKRRPNIGQHVEDVVAELAWRWTAAEDVDVDDLAAGKVVSVKQSTPPAVSAPIRGSVLRRFAQQPGETLFRNDVASDLGLTIKQVQNAMWHLLNENDATKADFVVVQPGYAWQYRPNRPVKTEMNGHTPDARVVATSAGPQVTSVTPVKHATQPYTPAAATTTLPVSSKVPVTPAATPKTGVWNRVFNEIATLADGDVLIREPETGQVYRATPLQ